MQFYIEITGIHIYGGDSDALFTQTATLHYQ